MLAAEMFQSFPLCACSLVGNIVLRLLPDHTHLVCLGWTATEQPLLRPLLQRCCRLLLAASEVAASAESQAHPSLPWCAPALLEAVTRSWAWPAHSIA